METEINGLVGATAWRAWILIYRDGPHTAAELKTKLKRSAELVNLSLGWLAREDRVEIVRTRKGIRVKLREDWTSPSRRARPVSARHLRGAPRIAIRSVRRGP